MSERDYAADLKRCREGSYNSYSFLYLAEDSLAWYIERVMELESLAESRRKQIDLLMAGMESQCELMDGLKQETRSLKAEVARLTSVANRCEYGGGFDVPD